MTVAAPIRYLPTELTEPMLAAVRPYERRFGVVFSTFTRFSKTLLEDLHAPAGDPIELPANVTVASRTDPSILPQIALLQRVANTPDAGRDDCEDYYEALQAIYRKLGGGMVDRANRPDTLSVGPQREGRILAERLGCMPEGSSWRPHLKRIHFDGGLLVGMNGPPPPEVSVEHCVLIDGAIASGATIMTVLEHLRGRVASCHIYSVHAPYGGLRALCRYAASAGIELHIDVGHATVGLNEEFYATDPDDPQRLMVGDLGDHIADVAAHCAAGSGREVASR